MAAIHQLYNMNQQGLLLLNQVMAVLMPKKPNVERISDVRSISLIHSFAKVISKLLANRLMPELGKLITYNQIALIKKDVSMIISCLFHQVIKDLHRKKVPTLFIKVDISKMFDTVSWSYLLHILSFLSFGRRWRNWVSTLWATSLSSFILIIERVR
jgi:hypothetical protein